MPRASYLAKNGRWLRNARTEHALTAVRVSLIRTLPQSSASGPAKRRMALLSRSSGEVLLHAIVLRAITRMRTQRITEPSCANM